MSTTPKWLRKQRSIRAIYERWPQRIVVGTETRPDFNLAELRRAFGRPSRHQWEIR